MSAQIKFRIDKDGMVHIEVDGVQGSSCSDLTRPFEERLGTKVDVQVKPDYDVILDGIEQHVAEE